MYQRMFLCVSNKQQVGPSVNYDCLYCVRKCVVIRLEMVLLAPVKKFLYYLH